MALQRREWRFNGENGASIKGIKISELPTWSGNSDGDLADHYATTAKMCYLVPDLSAHFTYIMYMTLRGRALNAVDLQNASLGMTLQVFIYS
jgi:hypothetical protein